MKWVAFCSQTGSEIKSISEFINQSPNLVITNNNSKLSTDVVEWIVNSKIQIKTLPNKPQPEDYHKLGLKNSLITLHGYTRILPIEFINQHPTIYNGHPGLITKYPELKGFNPQQKAYELGMKELGSVIHKVIDRVDEGEIICESKIKVGDGWTLEDYYINLRKCSLNTWIYFFTNKLYI